MEGLKDGEQKILREAYDSGGTPIGNRIGSVRDDVANRLVRKGFAQRQAGRLTVTEKTKKLFS